MSHQARSRRRRRGIVAAMKTPDGPESPTTSTTSESSTGSGGGFFARLKKKSQQQSGVVPPPSAPAQMTHMRRRGQGGGNEDDDEEEEGEEASLRPLDRDYSEEAFERASETLAHPAKLQFVHLMISEEKDRNETLRNEIRSSAREIVNRIADGLEGLKQGGDMMERVQGGLKSVHTRSRETRALIHSYALIRKIHTAHQNVSKIISSLRFFRDVGSEVSRLNSILKREWLELESVMKRMGESVAVPKALFPKRYLPKRRRRRKKIVTRRRRKKKAPKARSKPTKKRKPISDGLSDSDDDEPRRRKPRPRDPKKGGGGDGLSDSPDDDFPSPKVRRARARARAKAAARGKKGGGGDGLSDSESADNDDDDAESSSSSWEEYEEEVSESESDVEEDTFDDGLSDSEDDDEDLGLIYLQHKLNSTRQLEWEAVTGLKNNLTYQSVILNALRPLKAVIGPFKELFRAYCVRLQRLAMDYPEYVGLVAKVVVVQERIDEEMVQKFARAAARLGEEGEEEGEEDGLHPDSSASRDEAMALRRARRRRMVARQKARLADEKQYRMGLLDVLKEGIQFAIVDQFDEGRKKRLELLEAKKKEQERKELAANLKKEKRAQMRDLRHHHDSDDSSDVFSDEDSDSDDEIILEEEEGHFDMEKVLENMEESISDLPHIKKLIAVHFPEEYSIMEQFVQHYYVQTKQFIVENMGGKLDGRNCLYLIQWMTKTVGDLFREYEQEYEFVRIQGLTQYAETLTKEFLQERRQRLGTWAEHVVDQLFKKFGDKYTVQQDEKTLCVYTRGPVDVFQFLGGSTQQIIGFELPELLLRLLDVVNEVLEAYGKSVLSHLEGEYRVIFSRNRDRYVPLINDFAKLSMLLRVKKNEILRTGIFESMPTKVPEQRLSWMIDGLPAVFNKMAKRVCYIFRSVIAEAAEDASEGLFTDAWAEGTRSPMKSLIDEMKQIWMFVDCLEPQFKETFRIAEVVLVTYIGRLCQSDRKNWRISAEDDEDLDRFSNDHAMFAEAVVDDLGGAQSLAQVLPHITDIMVSTSPTDVTRAIGSLLRYPDFPRELCVRLAELGQRELQMKLPLIDQLFASRTAAGEKTFFSIIHSTIRDHGRSKGRRMAKKIRQKVRGAVGGLFRSAPAGPDDSPSPKKSAGFFGRRNSRRGD